MPDASKDADTPAFANVDENATVILPAGVSFSDLTSKVVYESSDENVLGTLVYSYADRVVGKADVQMNDIGSGSFTFKESAGTEEEASEDDILESQPEKEKNEKTKDPHSIHIEINAKTIAMAVGAVAGLAVLILLLYWLGTHSYIIRQKIAGMRSRRSERRRYQTIRDTRKSRRRGKKIKKSKN